MKKADNWKPDYACQNCGKRFDLMEDDGFVGSLTGDTDCSPFTCLEYLCADCYGDEKVVEGIKQKILKDKKAFRDEMEKLRRKSRKRGMVGKVAVPA